MRAELPTAERVASMPTGKDESRTKQPAIAHRAATSTKIVRGNPAAAAAGRCHQPHDRPADRSRPGCSGRWYQRSSATATLGRRDRCRAPSVADERTGQGQRRPSVQPPGSGQDLPGRDPGTDHSRRPVPPASRSSGWSFADRLTAASRASSIWTAITNQRGRCQTGGTTLPRLAAMTNITMPVVVHKSSASTDDSTPKLPPVSQSGPLMVDRIRPCWASLPETTPEKTADCV